MPQTYTLRRPQECPVAADTHRVETEKPADIDERYEYLERRSESRRRQLYLTGRNMTVDQLVRGMIANRLSPEAAAANYELPLDQIHEALRYYDRHQDVIERDWQEERAYLVAQGLYR